MRQQETERPVRFEITPATRETPKPKSTIRSLGIEVDDALAISEQTDI